MRKLAIVEFLTLDGVMQGLGGPDEDREGGFDQGGWSAPYGDEVLARQAGQGIGETSAYLFGRKTYEHMAAFWPTDAGLRGDPAVASRMNAFDKIVVSRTLTEPGWGPVTVLSDDVPAQLAKIKGQPGRDIALLGSSDLAASLLGSGVIDEVRIMVNPVVLGDGHPVLAGADPTALERLGIRQFSSGNVLLTYQPTR